MTSATFSKLLDYIHVFSVWVPRRVSVWVQIQELLSRAQLDSSCFLAIMNWKKRMVLIKGGYIHSSFTSSVRTLDRKYIWHSQHGNPTGEIHTISKSPAGMAKEVKKEGKALASFPLAAKKIRDSVIGRGSSILLEEYYYTGKMFLGRKRKGNEWHEER